MSTVSHKARIHARSRGQAHPQCVRMRDDWWAWFSGMGSHLRHRPFDPQIEFTIDLINREVDQ